MKVTRHKLKNGIKVVLVEMPEREIVATSVYIGAGGRYETPDTYGMSHFLEHLLCGGTKKYPSRQLLTEEIEKIGGSRNASTYSEWTRFFNKVPKNHLKIAFDVLSEQVTNPLLKVETIENEKGVIKEEIHRAYDNPRQFLSHSVLKFLWEGQPMESDILGSEKNILSFTKDKLLNYFSKHFVSENMVICVAGTFDPSDVLEKLEDSFSGVRVSQKVAITKLNMEQEKSRVLVLEKDINQAQVALIYKSFSTSDKRIFALKVLTCILGGGSSSVLYEEIRAKRGLAYSIGAYNSLLADGGCFQITSGLNKDNVEKAIKIIKLELEKAKKQHFSESQIKRAKEFQKGNYVFWPYTSVTTFPVC